MTIWNSTCNPCFSTFDQIFFVFHGLKTGFFCYSLKLNFICYPNRFFIYDYSLWDGGDIHFCGQKQTLIHFDFILLFFSQLLDFRNVIARMLGLDMNTLAIPDYEIISRLEKLIQAHHSHAFTSLNVEEAFADMEDGFISGYEEYRRSAASSGSSTIARSRERARRKAARARARSASPMRRDHRVY